MKKSAFTLVELIVVITILAILGTIAFISLNSYSASARDAKRLSDIRSLYTKLTLENTKGVKYETLVETEEKYELQIDGETRVVGQGIVNFENLEENRSAFQDPQGYDYRVAYSEAGLELADTTTSSIERSYIELGTISEKEGVAVTIGNYSQMDSDDTPSLLTIEDSLNPNVRIPILNNENTLPYNPGITPKPSNCEAQGLDGFSVLETPHRGSSVGEKIGVDIGEGTQTIRQNFECYNGVFTKVGEEEITNICNEGNVWSMTEEKCALDTCNGTLPDNAVSNGTQAYGNTWSHNTTPGVCTYICDSGYTLNGNICEEIINGECGSANNTNSKTKPTSNLCANQAIASEVLGNGPWTWTCSSPNGGMTSTTCEVNLMVDGVCGDGGGTTITDITPGTNLCNVGNPTAVIANGNNWTWTCEGPNGGVTPNCSRPRAYCQTRNWAYYVGIDSDNLIIGTPIYSNQSLQKNATTCGFKCKTGYSGQGCTIITPTNITITHSGTDIVVKSGTSTIYTIADRNVGATSSDYTNANSYGTYFQWGRTDGGFITTSELPAEGYDTKYFWAAKAQGPCPSGRHIPTNIEWEGAVLARFSYRGGVCDIPNYTTCPWTTGGTATFANFQSDFKLPINGYKNSVSGGIGLDGIGRYATSSGGNNKTATEPWGLTNHFQFYSSNIRPTSYAIRGLGMAVRCFKN